MTNAHVVGAALAVAAFAAPVAAQTNSAPARTHGSQAQGDPNERICEDIKLTGSRLAVRRFCGTRAEWAERQLQDKMEVERIQRSPCVVQRTASAGRSSC